MKVLIMSDSHGLTSEIDDIKNRHNNEVSFMLHCGDSELSADRSELTPFKVVKGNCDFGSEYPNDIFEDLDGLSMYMTHGHLYNVKASLMNLKYRALEVEANIVCYGHSHIAAAEMIDDILFINPGSIRLPVLRRQKTYAIIEVEQNLVYVTYYEVNGKIIEELSKTFTFES